MTDEPDEATPYEVMRNDWLNARFVPPEGHRTRMKNDGHHFNLGIFDDIYKLGEDAAMAKVTTLREALEELVRISIPNGHFATLDIAREALAATKPAGTEGA